MQSSSSRLGCVLNSLEMSDIQGRFFLLNVINLYLVCSQLVLNGLGSCPHEPS